MLDTCMRGVSLTRYGRRHVERGESEKLVDRKCLDVLDLTIGMHASTMVLTYVM